MLGPEACSRIRWLRHRLACCSALKAKKQHVPQGLKSMQSHKTWLHADALVQVQTAARRAASLCVLALTMSAASM